MLLGYLEYAHRTHKCTRKVWVGAGMWWVQDSEKYGSLEQSILWKRGGVFLPAVRQKASRFSIGSQETFQFDMLILTHYQCINSYTLSMQEHQELPKMPLP